MKEVDVQDRIFQVRGMTCDHCVRAVRSEVAGVAGVVDVDVDLATGILRVRSDAPIDPDAVLAAVREAGYDGVATD